MGTYFTCPENQRETSNIIHLRESLPSSYSEGQVLQGNMMMYMNYASSSSSGAYSGTLPGNAQQREMLTDLGGGSLIGDHDLNEWKDGRTGMLLMHPMGAAPSVFQGPQGQGLSLTLSTHVPSGFQMPPFQCRNPDQVFASFMSGTSEERNGTLGNNDSSPNKQSRVSEYVPPGFPGGSSDPMTGDASPYGMSGIARVVPNSKYLKAAQQLLDEVVNVKKAMKDQNFKNKLAKDSKTADGGAKNGASEPTTGAGSSSNVEESSTNSPGDLSAAEKQDLQNKMAKLLAMLDEVDRRYKQYYHQMQIVVSSFDVIAGSGAAKPYTALALLTISRHFRCMRDAINEQVQVTRKSLGEQDSSENGRGVGISRLRYVDQQIRQQRALQQLGMMQQHDWRPQRGLPETSVSILRAWLFEHFLHPYPKDSDKIMLARQTGLTRSQVSNWFINARVRLWKPMVDEMYKEEIGDGEMDINSPSDLATKPTNSEAKASEDIVEDLQQSTTSTPTERCSTGQLFESRSDHFIDTEFMEQNIDYAYQNTNHTETENEYSLSGKSIVQSNEGSERLMAEAAAAAAYHMSELERFENRNGGVSLTLGLQQCEGSNNVPMSIETHQGYTYTSVAAAASSMGSEATEFDCMEAGNHVSHHRFGSTHLLHDFVA